MSQFEIAVNLTLAHEGGFQKDYNDRGNWTGGQVGVGQLKGTNMGISAFEFPNVNIEDLTVEEVKNIYYEKYWGFFYAAINDQSVASKLFDLGVLFGVGTAIEVLQEVLKPHFPDVEVDKVFGSATLAAVNASDPVSLLVAYKTAFVARAVAAGAKNPNERGFVQGWITRINS